MRIGKFFFFLFSFKTFASNWTLKLFLKSNTSTFGFKSNTNISRTKIRTKKYTTRRKNVLTGKILIFKENCRQCTKISTHTKKKAEKEAGDWKTIKITSRLTNRFYSKGSFRRQVDSNLCWFNLIFIQIIRTSLSIAISASDKKNGSLGRATLTKTMGRNARNRCRYGINHYRRTGRSCSAKNKQCHKAHE